ncbi:hypothetical protein [Kitasatospora fiedleri]|uniref:hypothetical protein n=1 Tax=Kitasatospora fiedleri TaxID=2991545 RepID=UPI00249ADF4C|nr:hypothetical protein [Kitasatospora fiedleri]
MKPLPELGRRRRSAGSIAAGVLLLTALVAQSGPAFAAAVDPSPGASASTGTGASAGAKPAAEAPHTPAAGPQAAPKADPQAEHAAAAKALQESDPAGACPAVLDPQAPTTCTVPAYATAAMTLTLPEQKDLLLLQLVAAQQYSTYPTLLAPDGGTVPCESVAYGNGLLRCATTQAGTYTLQVRNGSYADNALSVGYLPLLTSTTGCRTLSGTDLDLGAPKAFHGSLAVGAVGDCYRTDLAAGDVLRVYGPDYRETTVVYDGTGKQVCSSQTASDPSRGLDCALTGTAPYRVTVQQSSGAAQEYDFRAARLSAPQGCAAVTPQAYGEAPDRSSAARCRTLRVPAAGRYLYAPVTASGDYVSGRLFESGGSPSDCQSGDCALTAGDHTWVLDGNFVDAGAFGVSFRSAKETRGCTATADDGLASGAVTGTYGAAGQQRCLTLPTASGKGLYLLNRRPVDGSSVAVEIDDANGAKQCDNGGYGYAVCKLTGSAPFRAVLSADPGKAYALVIHRTDAAAGCTAWPQSGYGGSWGVEVALDAATQQRCLSVPAAQHSPAEMLDYANNANSVNAAVYVVDGAGNPVCSTLGSSTTTCQFTPGTAYTAMLVGTGWADTYHLVRRDISPSAPCTPLTSNRVGAPSTPFDFTSALDARCVRVSGAATDRFWLSSRTVGGRYDPSSLLMAVDADGKIQCRQWGVSCKVTGSTSYVAVVVASGYQGKTIHADVDAWKVGGAGGWAPECTADKLSADGFAQRSGVLTESAPAYCGVVDLQPHQGFTVAGTSSATGVDMPWFSISGPDEWSDSSLVYQCTQNYGQFGAACTNTGATAGQAVLILSPNKLATPIEYTLVGLPGNPTSAYGTPRSISPATGPAGTLVPAVITGTGLSMGSRVQLVPAPSGSRQLVRPQSASADGSTLNVLVDTNGLEPGSYDLVNEGIGYTSGQPSPGYLPHAFTVTAAAAPAASRFVPVTPARFLDTRDGTGAPRARVSGGGVVALQVAGVKGVPATGVTAVVMNVTAVDPSEDGHVTVYPDGQAAPNASNVNFGAHRTVPNLVTVPVVNGKVDLRNNSGSVDLIADVTGYYTGAADQGSAFTPLTPARFLDTRDGTGAPRARVGGGGVVALQVAGVKGVPAGGVTAVVMNVTAVDPSEDGHVTVYPDGKPLPNVSNLNFTRGQIVPNLVTVPVVNGKVDLRNNSGSVDLIADVTGYYAADGAGFAPTAPQRLLDTRYGTGARAGQVGPDGIVSFQVGGVGGVPYGATAVVLNVTVTAPTDASHLIAYPHGTDRPGVSNLNYTPGLTVSNLVVVPVVDGRVTLYNHSGNVQVIADLNGYFTA